MIIRNNCFNDDSNDIYDVIVVLLIIGILVTMVTLSTMCLILHKNCVFEWQCFYANKDLFIYLLIMLLQIMAIKNNDFLIIILMTLMIIV